MDVVARVKNICLTPNTEWPVIAAEPTDTGSLIAGYAAPLAAIGALAGFIGGSVVGHSLPFVNATYRVPIGAGVAGAVFSFVAAIVGVFVLSLIINALAPTFGGQPNSGQALKVAVYSYTPAWVAGVLLILPALGLLIILAALYGLYLLYLGLPTLMKCPTDKAVGYTVVVVVCAIVISLVLAAIGGVIIGTGAIGARMMGGGTAGFTPTRTVQYDKDSAMGKLQAIGKKMEESNKKMEAAQKSGDQNAQVAAAMEGLGTLLGGGKRVDPVGIEELKPFVPDTFAGLPKKSTNAEKTGMAGLMVSKIETVYGDATGRRVRLQVSDTGGVSGLLGLASWIGVEGEKQDDRGSERTHKVNGRLVHEKVSNDGGNNEFGLVLGDRFVVSASGVNVDLNQLKEAVSSINLSGLESMKAVGVQK